MNTWHQSRQLRGGRHLAMARRWRLAAPIRAVVAAAAGTLDRDRLLRELHQRVRGLATDEDLVCIGGANRDIVPVFSRPEAGCCVRC